jgi:hypothetical protein
MSYNVKDMAFSDGCKLDKKTILFIEIKIKKILKNAITVSALLFPSQGLENIMPRIFNYGIMSLMVHIGMMYDSDL